MSKYRQFNIIGKMTSPPEKPRIHVSGQNRASVTLGKDYYQIHLDFMPYVPPGTLPERGVSNFSRRIGYYLSKIRAPASTISKNGLYIAEVEGNTTFDLKNIHVSYFKTHLSTGLIYQ